VISRKLSQKSQPTKGLWTYETDHQVLVDKLKWIGRTIGTAWNSLITSSSVCVSVNVNRITQKL